MLYEFAQRPQRSLIAQPNVGAYCLDKRDFFPQNKRAARLFGTSEYTDMHIFWHKTHFRSHRAQVRTGGPGSMSCNPF